MKKSLFALALLSALGLNAAHADTVFFVGNQNGGQIRLTDNTAPQCQKGYQVAYSTGADVNAMARGCWHYMDRSAHIVWADGTERMFPIDRFTITQYGMDTYGDKSQRNTKDGV